MNADGSLTPPRGADPVDAFLPPPQESVLIDSSLAAIKPQTHTTLLDTSVFPVAPNQTPPPTLLPPSSLASQQPVPKVSILPENRDPQAPPPQRHTSVLDTDLFPSTPPPKLPNLVRPMPKKS